MVSNFRVKRGEDRRRMAFSWDVTEAVTGYVIRWGAAPGQLGNAAMVYGDQAEFGFFDRDLTYYVTIEAFNESGKSKRSASVKVE